MFAWYSRWKFSFLLAALLGLLVVQSFFENFAYHQGIFHFFYSLTLVTAVLAFAADHWLRVFLVILGAFAFFGSWSAFAAGSEIAHAMFIFDRAAGILFMTLTTAVVLKRVITERNITADTLIGTVCVYLLIASSWALSYSLLEFLKPGSFLIPASLLGPAGNPDISVNEWLYFSFMTFTTLGYSPILPQNPAAGTLTWLEVVTGQFYMAILVARLVGMHLGPFSAAPVETRP